MSADDTTAEVLRNMVNELNRAIENARTKRITVALTVHTSGVIGIADTDFVTLTSVRREL